MSDYKRQTGKIRKVIPNENETLEELIERIKIENNVTDLDDIDVIPYQQKYIITTDSLYEILECEKKDAYDSFCDLNDNKDGTYSFHAYYYDGGTYLNEMIENEIYKIK